MTCAKRGLGQARGRLFLILGVLLIGGGTATGADAEKDAASAPKERVKVFIFAGQSNMVGRSNPKLLPEEYRSLPANVRLYANQAWRELGGPIRNRNDGVGPEVSAAGLLSAAFPKEKIVLVKTAVGGTNLHTQWNPTRKGSLYERMLKDVKQATAGQEAQIMAIFWAQGGSDTKTEPEAKAYGKNLAAFIKAARRDLGREDLPFIFTMRPPSVSVPVQTTGKRRFSAEVGQGKAEVARTVPHTATVTTRGMSLMADHSHYDTAGTIEFGRRFVAVWEKGFHKPANSAVKAAGTKRPNVILIMTDDQGYGDSGAHGNPHIKTPHLDRFASESVEVDPFYVSPVCSPTRASLMTGRWNYRTGVTDTFAGRSMMRSSEITVAEILRDAGYRTGIFGKWHLGDCYPFRPIDQGFEDSLVHRGGILGAGTDPPGTSYFNPILQRNGKSEQTKGYCTDVFTDAAIEFITSHREAPFFAYIPYNCPHGPFQIAENYVAPYKKMGLKPTDFPASANPIKISPHTASAYGMITNVDDNLGRLFKTVDDLGLRDDTIVIFLTDNGANGLRYRAGFRKYKGSVYEGGIRTMFYIRWPAALKAGHKVDQVCANIDILPTLAEACGASIPKHVKLDGRSFLPLLKQHATEWPDRNLYFQWHRGQKPTAYLGFTVRAPRYKLLYTGNSKDGPTYSTPGRVPKVIPFELYDLQADPLESTNIAAGHPGIVASLRSDYDRWLTDVTGNQDFAVPSIIVGTPQENPSTLTRQDFANGWKIGVEQPGQFKFVGVLQPAKVPGTAYLEVQGQKFEQRLPANATQSVFSDIHLAVSPTFKLRMWTKHSNNRRQDVKYVETRRSSGPGDHK